MSVRTICYRSGSTVTTVGMDEAGTGPSIVFLPALSSISTRTEMCPLLDRLAPEFRVSTIDWPGFGGRLEWSQGMLSAFLDWFLSEIVAPPHVVVAAGHAASYALYHAAFRPRTIKRLVPSTASKAARPFLTWRGRKRADARHLWRSNTPKIARRDGSIGGGAGRRTQTAAAWKTVDP